MTNTEITRTGNSHKVAITVFFLITLCIVIGADYSMRPVFQIAGYWIVFSLLMMIISFRRSQRRQKRLKVYLKGLGLLLGDIVLYGLGIMLYQALFHGKGQDIFINKLPDALAILVTALIAATMILWYFFVGLFIVALAYTMWTSWALPDKEFPT